VAQLVLDLGPQRAAAVAIDGYEQLGCKLVYSRHYEVDLTAEPVEP
jgi:hypothetical protein